MIYGPLIFLSFIFAASAFGNLEGPANVIVVKEGVDHTRSKHFRPIKQAVFSCVLKAVDGNYVFQRRPLTRHMRELGDLPYDISFPVASSYHLKPGEQLSAPLALEEWYWIMHSKIKDGIERPSIEKSTIAVIQGSEEEAWLLSMGVNNLKRVFDIDQLIKLFIKGRVDLLLIDRETLKEFALDMGLDITPYFFKFERYVSFSALFSQAIMNRKKDLLKKFNESIPSCATQEELLDPSQRIEVEKYGKKVYEEVVKSETLALLFAQKSEIENPDYKTIAKLEAEWLKPKSKLVDKILERELSKELKNKIMGRFHFIKEAILFDASGGLVAASGMTSDYYQGDELKHSETFAKGQDLFFDRLRFDESTKKFLVQITMMIKAPTKVQKNLALTVGIDVSALLHDLKRNQDQKKQNSANN